MPRVLQFSYKVKPFLVSWDAAALAGSSLTKKLTLEPLSRATILGAHNSAVKGIIPLSFCISHGDEDLLIVHLTTTKEYLVMLI